MPILPENKARYPKNWMQIRCKVLARAALCEFCGAKNYEPHPITGSKVVLTIAHLDHTPENCDLGNLKALCQKCHNSYDAKTRALNKKRRATKNQLTFKTQSQLTAVSTRPLRQGDKGNGTL